MAYADFVQQMMKLGYEVEERPDNRVLLPYKVEVGRFAGQQIQLGFVVPGDFPLQCPSGPFVSPHLLPLSDEKTYPTGGVHQRPDFGSEFRYWSRPFNAWDTTDKTVRAYMAHIRRLFADLQ